MLKKRRPGTKAFRSPARNPQPRKDCFGLIEKEPHLRTRILPFILISIMLAVACTPQAAPALSRPASKPATLTVLAAASLSESFSEIGALFESQHPSVTVAFSFAGSQQLAQQLGQGADADVFASASQKSMQAVIDEKRVNTADAKIFIKNRLVVIFPASNPAGLSELKDLARARVKLDLADKSVPVGQYALEFLEKAAADPSYGSTFKDEVLKNVVSYEENVKLVFTKVALGEADAGIVYVTDINPAAADRVGKIDIPDALNVIAEYPIAPIADSRHADLAKAFIKLVLSADGQAVLAKYGFLPASK